MAVASKQKRMLGGAIRFGKKTSGAGGISFCPLPCIYLLQWEIPGTQRINILHWEGGWPSRYCIGRGVGLLDIDEYNVLWYDAS